MYSKWGSLQIILLIVLSGCLGEVNQVQVSDYGYSGSEMAAGMPSSLPSPMSKSYESSPSEKVSKGESLVIKTGSATVNVQAGKLEESFKKLKTLISENRGTIESVRYSESASYKSYHVVVKLRPESFDTISSALKSLGEMKSLNTNSEDVTFEYIDLQAKIDNLEKGKERLQKIYETADTVEDIIKVEAEINRIQTDLDSSNSRKTYLERQIANARLTINLVEEAPILDKTLILPLSSLVNTFAGTFAFSILAVIGIFGFLIPFVPAMVVVIIVLRAIKRFIFKDRKLQIPFGKKK